jgi:transcriptional regulator with XRE-family HTH domain
MRQTVPLLGQGKTSPRPGPHSAHLDQMPLRSHLVGHVGSTLTSRHDRREARSEDPGTLAGPSTGHPGASVPCRHQSPAIMLPSTSVNSSRTIDEPRRILSTGKGKRWMVVHMGQQTAGSDPMIDNSEGRRRTLADKLAHLYVTVRPAGRSKPYTDREVAAAITAQGVEISASYLNLLRTGRKTNPTLRHLQALAQFFGVPVAYLCDDGTVERVDAELARLTELRELQDALNTPEVRVVALKARGLSAASLERLGDIIDHVRQLERQGRTPEEESGARSEGRR